VNLTSPRSLTAPTSLSHLRRLLVKTIDLGTGDPSKTTTIGAGLDPK
jgi:hypothetical protein